MTRGAEVDTTAVLQSLGLQLFERGWLSSNNVLFPRYGEVPATVVDTGYATHAAQTVALVESALRGEPLERIVNTHLHSDHCGANAALQQRWAVQTYVPSACVAAVRAWDPSELSFEATDQRCDRFSADLGLSPGDDIALGARRWEVHAAPGHDPTALMFFEPVSRVLISGDALWERRLAIIFPELVGEQGFDACMRTLDAIERLQPQVVIPGHGRAFAEVADALKASRERVGRFAAAPDIHVRHAVRALAMFRMLEAGRCSRMELARWMERTPITQSAATAYGPGWAADVVDGLVHDGALGTLEDDVFCR
jgi:glyoxylase-like metal-dependent hydrolase (beta-lactamase superfamily II)